MIIGKRGNCFNFAFNSYILYKECNKGKKVLPSIVQSISESLLKRKSCSAMASTIFKPSFQSTISQAKLFRFFAFIFRIVGIECKISTNFHCFTFIGETTRYSAKYYILFLRLKKITIYCIFLLTTTRWSGMIHLVAVGLPIRKERKRKIRQI